MQVNPDEFLKELKNKKGVIEERLNSSILLIPYPDKRIRLEAAHKEYRFNYARLINTPYMNVPNHFNIETTVEGFIEELQADFEKKLNK